MNAVEIFLKNKQILTFYRMEILLLQEQLKVGIEEISPVKKYMSDGIVEEE